MCCFAINTVKIKIASPSNIVTAEVVAFVVVVVVDENAVVAVTAGSCLLCFWNKTNKFGVK